MQCSYCPRHWRASCFVTVAVCRAATAAGWAPSFARRQRPLKASDVHARFRSIMTSALKLGPAGADSSNS